MKIANGTIVPAKVTGTSSGLVNNAAVTPGAGTVTVTSSGSVTVELGGFLKSPAGQQQLVQMRELRAAQATTPPAKDGPKKAAG